MSILSEKIKLVMLEVYFELVQKVRSQLIYIFYDHMNSVLF